MNTRNYLLLFIVFILSPPVSQSQSFTGLLTQLSNLPLEKRQQLADSFHRQGNPYPFMETDTTVYYICYSQARKIQIAGDETNWKPAIEMNRVKGTNLWFHKAMYPSDARLEYKFVYNDKDWSLDSLNHRKAAGGYGSNSELAMPSYLESRLIKARKDIPHGKLVDTALYSNFCKESRRVKIYFPAEYENTGKSYKLVVYHDGDDYLKFSCILNILDNLAASPFKMPVIAVFVTPVKRDPEYSGNRLDAYSGFIAEELIPLLLKNYRILPEALNHCTSGISNGGNVSLWLAVKYPQVFGKVAVHSSNIEKSVLKAYKSADVLPVKTYIDIGLYDMPELVSMFRYFETELKARKVTIKALTIPSGHNWNSWRNHMGEALQYLFSDK
ncbi:MAG: alpha/beta hydrolase-fold protein [Bacteroidales bacterium]